MDLQGHGHIIVVIREIVDDIGQLDMGTTTQHARHATEVLTTDLNARSSSSQAGARGSGSGLVSAEHVSICVGTLVSMESVGIASEGTRKLTNTDKDGQSDGTADQEAEETGHDNLDGIAIVSEVQTREESGRLLVGSGDRDWGLLSVGRSSALGGDTIGGLIGLLNIDGVVDVSQALGSVVVGRSLSRGGLGLRLQLNILGSDLVVAHVCCQVWDGKGKL